MHRSLTRRVLAFFACDVPLTAALALLPAAALALSDAGGPSALDYRLPEEVFRIRADALELEVTVFRPASPGPHPVVVMNHGRAPSPPRLQPRYRPLHAAYEFVRRGYAVVVPMRQGFSASDGDEADEGCDVRGNALRQGQAVRSAVQWVQTQPWADASTLMVMGPSHGGLATLAYGTAPLRGTRLLVNISGGLRMPACSDWEPRLVEAMASLAPPVSPIPSLWVYSDNDSHFRPSVWRGAFEGYVARGGLAALQEVGPFGDDGHLLFASRAGVPRWLPPVLQRMAARGMPTAVQTRLDTSLQAPEAPALPLLEPATEADVSRVATLGPSARRAYRDWLRALPPKAFALSADGRHWSAVWDEAQPIGKALQACRRQAGAPCRLLSVDGFLVAGSAAPLP
jgi:dienelactone hydrolase